MTGGFTDGTTLSATALNGAINGFMLNAQTGTTYTLVLGDAGKLVTLNNAAAVTVTIPLNSSVAYAVGTTIALLNLGAGTVTVSPTGGVTLTGTATISQNNGASLIKTGTDTWSIVSGGLPKASVSSSTGSPTTSANGSRTAYKWTGSGTVTLTEGLLGILVQAGGAGGGNTANGGGGGGGGHYRVNSVYVPAGTYTVTVGGGGAVDSPGSFSALVGVIVAPGGGAPGFNANDRGGYGGSGGGGRLSAAAGTGVSGLGNNGATTATAGGGGGANAAGSGTSGGAGKSDSITGSAVTYGAGGNGASGSGVAGTANSGNGGPGGNSGGTGAAAGGSGVVILLIG